MHDVVTGSRQLVRHRLDRHDLVRLRGLALEDLSYPDASFDAVVCSFGLLHFQNADAAISEAHRVLRKGGKYAFTAWCSPEQGCDFMKLVFGSIQAHGTLDVDLPPAPPMFRFLDPVECLKTWR